MATNEEIVDFLLLPKNKGMLDLLILAESGRGIEREVLARNTGRALASFALGSPLPAIDIRGAQGLTADQITNYTIENTKLKQNIAKQKAETLATINDQNLSAAEKKADLTKQNMEVLKTIITQAATNARTSGQLKNASSIARLDNTTALLEERGKKRQTYSKDGFTTAQAQAYNEVINQLEEQDGLFGDIDDNVILEIIKKQTESLTINPGEEMQRFLYNIDREIALRGPEPEEGEARRGLMAMIENAEDQFFGTLDTALKEAAASMHPRLAEDSEDLALLDEQLRLLDEAGYKPGGVSATGSIEQAVGAAIELGLFKVNENGTGIELNSDFDPGILNSTDAEQLVNDYFVPAENQITANLLALQTTGQGQKTFREVMVNVVLGDERYQEAAAEAAKLPRIFGRKKDGSGETDSDGEFDSETRRVAGQKRAQSRVLKAGRQIGKGKFEQKANQSMTPGEAYAARQQARLKRRKGEVLVESDAQKEAKAAQEKALKEGALGAVQNMGAPQRYAPPAPDSGSKYGLEGLEATAEKRKQNLVKQRETANQMMLKILEAQQ